LFWDDTNNRLGVGTNVPTTALELGGSNSIKLGNDGSLFLQGARFATNNGTIYFGDVNGSNTGVNLIPQGGGANGSINFGAVALAQFKGKGSTSATTSLLVQNSAGTAALTVSDDLVVTAPTFSTGAGADMTSNRVKCFVVRTAFINDEANNISVFSIGTARATYGGDRLNFNGNSSAFPSLKQSSTTLQARLADDSGYAPIDASLYKVGGTNGFTGTGSYTNFTIVGGIITNAS
jgi:hypothetical protein